MKFLYFSAATVFFSLTLVAPASAAEKRFERIVTLGSSITETVFALGHGDAVVGRDMSSQYPQEVNALPDVGYYRAFSVEGVLAQEPDLVLASSDSQPAQALEKIRAAGIPVEVIADEKTLAGAREKILLIGEILGEAGRATELVADLDKEIAAAKKNAENLREPVLFLMQVDGGSALAAGRGTGVDTMLSELGVKNLASEINSYQPINPEAVMAGNPQAVLLPDHAFRFEAGDDLPADLNLLLQNTDALRHRRVYTVDLALLAGFGPRTGQALKTLAELLNQQS